jgi:hypothetical protein
VPENGLKAATMISWNVEKNTSKLGNEVPLSGKKIHIKMEGRRLKGRA